MYLPSSREPRPRANTPTHTYTSASAHIQTTHTDPSASLNSRPHVSYDKFCMPGRLSLNQIHEIVQKCPAGRQINFKLQTALNPPVRVQSQADGKSMRCYLYFSPRTLRMEQETTVSLSSERTEKSREGGRARA